METRHEACSAEGQPRNILECNPNRFARRCPALSRMCHCVIHSCYVFLRLFREISLSCPGHPPSFQERSIAGSSRSSRGRASGDDAMHAAQDVGSVLAGLTTRQRGGAVCNDPEQRAGVFMISTPRQRLLRRSESPLSAPAAPYCQQGDTRGWAFE